MKDGYFTFPRSFFSSAIWREERIYSRAEAWVDLYQTANYAPGQHIAEGRCLSLARGELVASVRYLSKRWSWSRGKVERYLKLLKSPQIRLVETRTETGITIVTILNYDTYKNNQPPSETPPRPSARHPRDKEKEKKKKETLSPQPPAGGPEKEKLIISLPTIEEWHRYASQQPSYQPAPIAALYHYNAARGWRIGGQTVANWQALVDSWYAQHAPPPVAQPQSVPQIPAEPTGWQSRMLELYPQSDPASHTWAELCRKYPDVAKQLTPKQDQA